MESRTSQSLLEQLCQPKPHGEAWERFVKLYTPLILHWSHRRGDNANDAADLCQDVFVHLLKLLPEFTYNPELRFRSWLRTVTTNIWIQRCRKKQRFPVRATEEELSALIESDPLDLFSEQEHTSYLVRQGLNALRSEMEERNWQAAWEMIVEDRDPTVIAQELGTSVSAVYQARYRVKQRLTELLKGFLE